MTKKNRFYSKPEFQTFEEYKAWFRDFSRALGLKGPPLSDERMSEAWLKLKEAYEKSQQEEQEKEDNEQG